ncbi:MAG: hypothetical protein ACE5FJ_11655, partial [Gemmatimonadales bacterium]
MQQRSSLSLGTRLYVALILLLAATSTLAVVGVAVPYELGDEWIAIVAFFVLAIALELAEHRLATGHARGSIAFIVYMGSVITFGPLIGSSITALSFAGSGLLTGRGLVKTAFNVSQSILALNVGSLVYLQLGGVFSPTTLDSSAVPYVGIIFSYFIINSCAVSGVVAVSERRRFVDV